MTIKLLKNWRRRPRKSWRWILIQEVEQENLNSIVLEKSHNELTRERNRAHGQVKLDMAHQRDSILQGLHKQIPAKPHEIIEARAQLEKNWGA